MTLDPLARTELIACVGPGGWSDDAEVIASYLIEWRGRYQGSTPLLLLPASTAEVAAIVRVCAQRRIAITPQGGNTGLVGGQLPAGEVLVSLRRMKQICAVSVDDDCLTAEAGVVLTAVHAEARTVGRSFPLSLASQDSATVGGLISTNAGGVHVLRYGVMRQMVAGLEVVLPDGTIYSNLNPLPKDNTGYDLKQLFIGAEGTLGIITAATLRLSALPKARLVAFAGVDSPKDALTVLHRVKGRTDTLSAFELMDARSLEFVARHAPAVRVPLSGSEGWFLLLEFQAVNDPGLQETVETVLGECLGDGLLRDVLLASNEREAAEFWHARESISGCLRQEGAQLNNDISVPVSQVPPFLAQAGAAIAQLLPEARIAAFGHAGDGNIHYTVLQAAQTTGTAEFEAHRAALLKAVNSVALALGGSISAEHGIGVARRDELPLYKDPTALRLMKTLKHTLDPHGILNPRVMLQL